MIYGVFADVHSNLEALEAVLKFFEKSKIQNFICAGDIVGYGPNPNECIDKIKNLARVYCVAGNHDKAVVGMKSISWFNNYAQRVLQWTKRQLKSESANYLMRLPVLYEHNTFSIAHGSPRDPIDEYLLSPNQFQQNLPYIKTRVCFVGHTHYPVCFINDRLNRVKIKNLSHGLKIKIDIEAKALCNTGSVGQPRDGDPRAACAVFDSESKEISFYRLEYDVRTTQRKMNQAALPLFLTDRIAFGR